MIQSFEHHELVNQHIIKKLIRLSELRDEDVVLEIGPGKGKITQELCKSAKSIIAVEKDTDCIKFLELMTKKNAHLEIINGNILTSSLPPWNKLVANPPFNILEPLLYWLAKKRFDSAVLISGDNFSDKLTSEDPTRLALFSECYFNVSKEAKLCKDDFVPQPRTETVIIKITLKEKHELNNELVFLREFFDQSDKKVKNALIETCTRVLKLTKKQAKEKLKDLNLSDQDVNVLLISNENLFKLKQFLEQIFK